MFLVSLELYSNYTNYRLPKKVIFHSPLIFFFGIKLPFAFTSKRRTLNIFLIALLTQIKVSQTEI
jgi:hypothetical protein